MSELTLYDLPTKGPKRVCWSLNPWKTRFALNYKNIPFKTEWVEYPDVEPMWKKFGIGANKPEDYFIAYTAPMVHFPDGQYVMDSKPIAERLEKEYPGPSLHLDWEHLPKVFEHSMNIVGGTRPVWMPKVPDILSERSAEYFRETRKVWYKMSLEEMLRTEGSEPAKNWEKVKPDAKALGDMLRKTEGPYFRGEEPSYADFVLAGVIHCIKLVEEASYQELIKLDPALEPLYKSCGKWMERDDH